MLLGSCVTDARADGCSRRSWRFHYNFGAPIFPSPYGPYAAGYGLDFRYGSGWPPYLGDPLSGYYFSLPEPSAPPAAYGPWYTQPGPGFYFYYRK